jgi:hypothetical protein
MRDAALQDHRLARARRRDAHAAHVAQPAFEDHVDLVLMCMHVHRLNGIVRRDRGMGEANLAGPLVALGDARDAAEGERDDTTFIGRGRRELDVEHWELLERET